MSKHIWSILYYTRVDDFLHLNHLDENGCIILFFGDFVYSIFILFLVSFAYEFQLTKIRLPKY